MQTIFFLLHFCCVTFLFFNSTFITSSSDTLNLFSGESDEDKKQRLENIIKEVRHRIKVLEHESKNWKYKVDNKFCIIENQTNCNYNKFFQNYFTDDVKKIMIEEPYLEEFYQFYNLRNFCEFAVGKCKNLELIRVKTKINWNDQCNWASYKIPNFHDFLKRNTENLANQFVKTKIEFTFDGGLHTRQVVYVAF